MAAKNEFVIKFSINLQKIQNLFSSANSIVLGKIGYNKLKKNLCYDALLLVNYWFPETELVKIRLKCCRKFCKDIHYVISLKLLISWSLLWYIIFS